MIRSDGNGGYIISRGLAIAISILTLCSLVWGMSSAYVAQASVRPFEMRVAKLEKISEDRTVYLQQHCINEAEKFAEINRKMDLILYRIENPK
jgi:hypothetical protein